MAPTVIEKDEACESSTADSTTLDEQHWDAQFAGSLDVLENLYDEITAGDEAGRTTPPMRLSPPPLNPLEKESSYK